MGDSIENEVNKRPYRKVGCFMINVDKSPVHVG